MRSLINYDVIYSDGRLSVRKGFTRFNDTVLPAVATQIYPFVDMDGNEHILAILDTSTLLGDWDKWYEIMASGAHSVIRNQGSTAPRPCFSVGNRCFFGTTTDFYWTDHTQLAAATKSYHVGIFSPDQGPRVSGSTVSGNYGGVWGLTDIQTTTRRRLAASFTVTPTQRVRGIRIIVQWQVDATDRAGSVRVRLCADDGGEPGSTLTNGTSEWYPFTSLTMGNEHEIELSLPDFVTLTAATTYWIVAECDDIYYQTYDGAAFLLLLEHNLEAGAMRWDHATQSWQAHNQKILFWLGGLQASQYYDYVITYYNTTYGSESRPSSSERTLTAATPAAPEDYSQSAASVTYADSPFGQVDRIRIYRRLVGDDPDSTPADENYYLVAEAEEGASPFLDTVSDDLLGGQLQTEDHYCYDGFDDSLRPSHVIPYAACLWKGRLWM
jgi:hypothetical protein